MENTNQTIDTVIMEIARQRRLQNRQPEPQDQIITDLGFSSLDVAELVATLELRLGYDPFVSDVSIASVRTVCDLYHAYAPARVS